MGDDGPSQRGDGSEDSDPADGGQTDDLLAICGEVLDKLAAFTRKKLGPDDGEDAAQDAIASYLEKVQSGQFSDFNGDRDRIHAYIFGIARNKISQQLQERARQEKAGQERARALAATEQPGDGTDRELRAAVKPGTLLPRAKRVLTRPEYEAFFLRFHRGLQVQQVAQELGVPRTTVGSRLRSALKKIRLLLEDDLRDGNL